MQRCSKKAYAMCHTRHLCGPIEEAAFTEDSECATFNREVEDKPMTNADRIRAMSDEQLAEFLLSPLDLCAKCKETGKHCIVGFSSKHNEHCMNTMAKWIKQTVEGE